MSVIITVATTGPIATKADNPSLPTSPEEIAAAVADAYTEGAAVAHLHFRDAAGRPTADLAVAERTVGLIRDACPILVQISTGVGLGVEFAERERLIELRPQMATLNPCTMTFGAGEFRNPPADVRRLAARMQELGVKPEMEIYDTGHLDACLRLIDEGLISGNPQFSIVLGVRGGAAATPANLLTLVERLPENAVWQIIAIGKANLQLTAMGLAMGGNARAGLEDTLFLRKGELSPGNTPLVRRTVDLARALDLPTASVDEATRMLQLNATPTS
ncbi:3-keto-5-aminohexanoate cleavage protein [Streptomyces sp. NPDC050509]|uniref:3-keto-5-aminohexanoate cleavage protein n=1 Tax=Streptomyces TaxID=1883 RepID=UPI002DD8F2F0|nr:3-keto-5-aminohexanoate cleavage protein [Streptomyces scopuliridis]WSB35344.1 3-keto-5-aminohexanoate cleavage protein [Streptomyces scopuliridis]